MGRLNIFMIISFTLMIILDLSLSETHNVIDFGARGNGKDDDTQAFLKAWTSACASNSTFTNATMLVPLGKSYLLNPIKFSGPCKGQSIQVQIDGTLIAPTHRWIHCVDNVWIQFSNVKFLQVFGKGTLDAQGASWWKKPDPENVYEINRRKSPPSPRRAPRSPPSPTRGDPVSPPPPKRGGGSGPTPSTPSGGEEDSCSTSMKGGPCSRPAGIRFESCDNLELKGLTHLNPPGRHIVIYRCTGVQISNLNITAPKKSPNTDGIGIGSSHDVNITNSVIGTGDDCIAISSHTSNIYVGGVQCGPGHGISIGSLGQGGCNATVEGVYVQNCTFTGTDNGVRIKTWPGGKGYARNITFTDIILNDVKNAIIIDQKYCHGKANGCADKGTAVQLSDIRYINVQGTSATPQAISLYCSINSPCKNIIMNSVNITSISNGNVLANCSNADVSSKTFVYPRVSCRL